ncbi:MAG: PIN domain-containing protein [Deltaproteobacteria bacterium]|nr:PIN domain-containing protein [Deltaproteobacteria bacterium]
MDGYLLDTNAASVLWDERHREHTKIRAFLQKVADAPTWISIVVMGEIEYGLKIAPEMDEDYQDAVRGRMARFPLILDVTKHTIEPYSDFRAALFEKYSPRDKRGRLKAKWPEDLRDRTSAKELGVQENDLWIAAQAVQYNLVLITDDRMNRIQEMSTILDYSLQLASWR